jgi:SAM-dependent methyltransferase
VGRALLDRGCATYVGVDGSRNMVAAAQAFLAGTPGTVLFADLETWTFPQAAFDVVIARLVLHYLDDLRRCLEGGRGSLVPGGRLVFSVEHPLITANEARTYAGQPRTTWTVDRYFETGARTTPWLGSTVVKYHRTVEQYVSTLQATGLALDALREPAPCLETLPPLEYERRLRVPLFLLLAAHRP